MSKGLLSYKTTILAAVAAGLAAVNPIIVAVQTNGNVIDWKQLGFAFALGLLGYFSKDANK